MDKITVPKMNATMRAELTRDINELFNALRVQFCLDYSARGYAEIFPQNDLD